jgi:hypothetical protein
MDGEGRLVLEAETRAALSRKHAAFVNGELESKRIEHAVVDAELRSLTANLVTSDSDLRAELLLDLVNSLRNPYDTSYNAMWKQSLTITEMTREKVWQFETTGTITSWSGTIRISGAGHSFEAPWEGRYRDGAVLRVGKPVAQAIEDMRNGIPFWEQNIRNAEGIRQAIAVELGYDTRHCGVTDCPHPLLVRVAIRLATDKQCRSSDVAAEFDIPEELVEDVRERLTMVRRNWAALIDAWGDVLN